MAEFRHRSASGEETTLFLCGDVMTGRGVDQVLPHPGNPTLFEPYVRSAETYVALAEERSGAIDRPVAFDALWGDAADMWSAMRPVARIVNLETAVTARGAPAPEKSIHYRMHPDNAPCLAAAAIDCCVLANNHVLDWGPIGLLDTLDVLHGAGIETAGAGRDGQEAAAPAVIDLGGGARLLVFAWGDPSSGVPDRWAARAARPGVNRLPGRSRHDAEAIAGEIAAVRNPGDLVVASIHWGSNWSFAVSEQTRAFAHCLVDLAGVDIVHGHSSHHVKGIEVYRDRLILYGCGDFLNDYEGIEGYEAFRGDLSLMYFPTVERHTGRLASLVMAPTRMERLRIVRAGEEAASWLADTLDHEGQRFGTRIERRDDGMLSLGWR